MEVAPEWAKHEMAPARGQDRPADPDSRSVAQTLEVDGPEIL